MDTSNFDPEFTNALTTSSSLNARAAALAAGTMPASTPLSPTMQNAFRGFTFVDESTMESQFGMSVKNRAEDDQQEEDDWLQQSRSREHRMSGVEKTGGEDSIFDFGV
jgi:protein-serine/threonine kinase